MNNLDRDSSTSRTPGWRWANPSAYRIDLLQPNGRGIAGGWTAVLQAALFVVGYLLTVGSIVAFFAHYIGWSPSLLIVGVSHLVLAVFGLSSSARAEVASEVASDAEPSETGVTPILRPHRPPVFPPRTRSAP